MRHLPGALFFVAASLLALPATAQQPDLLAKVAAQIEQHAVIRADFTQTKQIAALKKPLVTSGKLVVSKQYGVLWQIEQPYRISYILGEERMVEIAADGTRRERNVRDLPGMTQVGRVFRAMLGANTQALRDYFEVRASGEVNRWDLELKPRPQLQQFLEGLKLEGGAFINAIRIDEAGGDRTQIQFRNTVGAAGLGDAEQRLFTGR